MGKLGVLLDSLMSTLGLSEIPRCAAMHSVRSAVCSVQTRTGVVKTRTAVGRIWRDLATGNLRDLLGRCVAAGTLWLVHLPEER